MGIHHVQVDVTRLEELKAAFVGILLVRGAGAGAPPASRTAGRSASRASRSGALASSDCLLPDCLIAYHGTRARVYVRVCVNLCVLLLQFCRSALAVIGTLFDFYLHTCKYIIIVPYVLDERFADNITAL